MIAAISFAAMARKFSIGSCDSGIKHVFFLVYFLGLCRPAFLLVSTSQGTSKPWALASPP